MSAIQNLFQLAQLAEAAYDVLRSAELEMQFLAK